MHVEAAIRAGHYIEAVSVLESILADRLGSLLHGITGQTVELDHTVGNLLYAWQNPPKKSRLSNLAKSSLPADIAVFLRSDLDQWRATRNEAVHAMAKLQHAADLTFKQKYLRLEFVALEGVRILLRLDELDTREKALHGLLPATSPHALKLDRDIEARLSKLSAPARYTGSGFS